MRRLPLVLVCLVVALTAAVPTFAIDPEAFARAKQRAEQALVAPRPPEVEGMQEKRAKPVPGVDKTAFTIIGTVVDQSDVSYLSDGTPFAVVIVRSKAGGTQDMWVSCLDNLAAYCATTINGRRAQLDGAVLSMDGVDPDVDDFYNLLVSTKIVGGK
jgi:hypothetical protein